MATFEEILQKIGVSPETLEQARQQQQEQGGFLREHLLALGELTEQTFATKISQLLRVPYVNVQNLDIPHDVLKFLPREQAEKYLALPIDFDKKNRRLTIVMADPTDMSALDEVKFRVGHTLNPRFAPEDELREKIERAYAAFTERELVASLKSAQPRDHESYATVDGQALLNADQPVVKLIGQLFAFACEENASQLEINHGRDRGMLLMTTQGKTREIAQLPLKPLHDLVIRLKRMLGIETAETTAACVKGHTILTFGSQKERDLSYLWYAGVFGEEMIVKFQDQKELPSIADFDMLPRTLRDLQSALRAKTGAIVVSGTMQSGLAATRCAVLSALMESHGYAMSVEAPIYAALSGLIQGEASLAAGDGYAEYLRDLLAQKPPVAMIDQLFDREMASSALRLAASAVVVTSIGAADAASAIVKLRAFGAPEFAASRVRCVMSQRLVKKICDACKERVELSDAHREKLGLRHDETCYIGKGCDQCGQTGYNGSTFLLEVFPCGDALVSAMTGTASAREIRALLAEEGIPSLRDDGMQKVKQGVTTIQEVLRATMI